MNEFIFTWSIENISYSWHEQGEELVSPSFVADTLQNTAWTLRFYPRGNVPLESSFDYFFSLYLIRGQDEGPNDFVFNCEFSCVIANNTTLTSDPSISNKGELGIGHRAIFGRYDFGCRREDLFMPQDILTLRCRMWKCEGDIDRFGQCFGRTQLELERELSVQVMNPRINRCELITIHSKFQKDLLMSVRIAHEGDSLDFHIFAINYDLIKVFTVKFSVVLENRNLIDCNKSWFNRPRGVRMKMRFSNTEIEASARNTLILTLELIYSTGKDTNSIEKISPCSFKFPEFPSKCILSFIPSGKMSDCPSVVKDLWDLYVKHILCDVELKTQTTSFWAHKTVLCARSPVFLAMLTSEMKEKTSNCVDIEDLKDYTLEKFLYFLYTDKFKEYLLNAVVELYYAADKYQVEKLKFSCCSFFINNINDINVCELLMLADKHSDSVLKSIAEDYIMRHYERIVRSSTWKELSEKQPLLAMRTRLCNYKKERRDDISGKRYMLSSYPNALEDFRSLYQSQTLSDIVIQTTSATFPAHKTMLCAGSSTLRKLLERKSHVSLKMENLEVDTVSRLLLFLYTDSLGDINWNTATKLYHAAFAYQIERLKIKCSCFFLENLKESNAANLLKLAHEHQDVRLKSLVEEFASRGYKKIAPRSVSEHWAQLYEYDHPQQIDSRLSKRLKLENDS